MQYSEYSTLQVTNHSHIAIHCGFALIVQNALQAGLVSIAKVYKHCICSNSLFKLHTDVQCFPPGDPIPLSSSSNNQTTVEGEAITFQCVFGGNYHKDYYVYWQVILQNGSDIIVDDDSNFPDYHCHTQQKCSNYSCCQFITQLYINKTNMPLNNAMITCNAVINSIISSSNTSYLSELSIHMV